MDLPVKDKISDLCKLFRNEPPIAHYCYIIKLNAKYSTDVQEVGIIGIPDTNKLTYGFYCDPYKLGRTKDPYARIISHEKLHPVGYILLLPFDNLEDSCTFEKIMLHIAKEKSLLKNYKKSREVILAPLHLFTEFAIQCTHYYCNYIEMYPQKINPSAAAIIRHILYSANVCSPRVYRREHYFCILDCWFTAAMYYRKTYIDRTSRRIMNMRINRLAYIPIDVDVAIEHRPITSRIIAHISGIIFTCADVI